MEKDIKIEEKVEENNYMPGWGALGIGHEHTYGKS